MGGEGGRSTYGLGEKLRRELSGRIISAQERVGERGDGRPAGTGAGVGAGSAMVHGLLYWVAAAHCWIAEQSGSRVPVDMSQWQPWRCRANARQTRRSERHEGHEGDACDGQ